MNSIPHSIAQHIRMYISYCQGLIDPPLPPKGGGLHKPLILCMGYHSIIIMSIDYNSYDTS